jgi:hypothetical protein
MNSLWYLNVSFNLILLVFYFIIYLSIISLFTWALFLCLCIHALRTLVPQKLIDQHYSQEQNYLNVDTGGTYKLRIGNIR